MMEAKDAISIAKDYIADIYNDEGVFNIGLEEIEYNDGTWEVTIGFSRKWDRPPTNIFSNPGIGHVDHRALARTYKIVEVNEYDKTVRGVRNRTGLL